MQPRNKSAASSSTAAALRLTSQIKPVRLGRSVAEHVGERDFRGAAILCRRALGAGRVSPPSSNPDIQLKSDQQRASLRELLGLVDVLRVNKRRGGRPASD